MGSSPTVEERRGQLLAVRENAEIWLGELEFGSPAQAYETNATSTPRPPSFPHLRRAIRVSGASRPVWREHSLSRATLGQTRDDRPRVASKVHSREALGAAMSELDGGILLGRMHVRRVAWAVEVEVLARLDILDDVGALEGDR